jgi:hypothetical protein
VISVLSGFGMITGVSLRPLYLIFVRVLGLALLMGRTPSSKDTELPVLRHEVAVLRRPTPSPAWTGRTGRCSPVGSRSRSSQLPATIEDPAARDDRQPCRSDSST